MLFRCYFASHLVNCIDHGFECSWLMAVSIFVDLRKSTKKIMLKYISLLSCLLVGALSQDLADVDTEAPGV